MDFPQLNQEGMKLRNLRKMYRIVSLVNPMSSRLLVKTDRVQESAGCAVNPMEHGHVLTLNRWIYRTGGTVLNSVNCASVV